MIIAGAAEDKKSQACNSWDKDSTRHTHGFLFTVARISRSIVKCILSTTSSHLQGWYWLLRHHGDSGAPVLAILECQDDADDADTFHTGAPTSAGVGWTPEVQNVG